VILIVQCTRPVASSNMWSERSQAQGLPASDKVTGDPLFLKESSS
jgi:hypothetical protein